MHCRFFKNRSGNISLIAGLLLVPVLLIAGAGIDYMRIVSAKSKLQSALDGAALAAASLSNNQDPNIVVTEYVRSNLKNDPELASLVTVTTTPASNNSSNQRTIGVTAQADLPTHFLKLAGFDTLSVSVTSQSHQSATSIEISLAVDISSSMGGAKLQALKDAANSFVDEIFDDGGTRISVNLIPFGGSVNLGDLYDDVVVTEASATVEPTASAYPDDALGIVNGSFRWPAVGNACVEMREEDFDASRIPNNSRSQVPPFWIWWNNHPWCPAETSAVVANSNNVNTLKNRIRDLTLSDGTGLDIAVAWGLKMLSPAYRGYLGGDFSDRPGDYDPATRTKILVIMSDGRVAKQVRPLDPTIGNLHVDAGLVNKAPTVTPNHHQGNTGYNQNRLNNTPYPAGDISDTVNDHTGIGHFKKLCGLAAADDIIVYTVGFQIMANSVADQTLADCATDPSKYYFVESLDIKSAFKSIAATITALRLSA